ncbi:uncharacterized protein LOC112523291 [Cynara cardunculus var. scolymus]|uniref:Uncharacterized protein n=1 Tax=Cynara cardunculus var. scolymus TaxID=59895 RepID=A0A103XUW8_CYNCS|nr:uncharacterized protein LOC112523291 [Cynara cardunculus var. scolymus]XP_024988594.1 uncharacterized protein LOC112523291 [Cynara cardunculus var. scolymus]KVH97318.1 hypothetical protein Ccrd_000586 [Cynara cardunculus var. scolymus]
MAAGAVWRRTANRCFDAKRAPKLACSTSSLLSKQVDNITDVNDSFSLLNNKLDPRWWLELQPDYIYQMGLTNEQVNARNHQQFIINPNGTSISSLSKESYEMDPVDWKFQQFEKNGELQLPWWQKDDLGSNVSKRWHDLHKGSNPQNAVSRVQVTSKPISPLGMANSNCAMHHGPREKPISKVDSSKAKILEALRHAQTRAREAENAAKEAYAEKEHVVKLLFRQASQLFAYRQSLYLLQLENLYYQIKNNKTNRVSKTGKLHKNLKKPPPAKRKTQSRDGVGQYEHDIGKYAVVFLMGLGLVGAGLLLGWTVGWMLI